MLVGQRRRAPTRRIAQLLDGAHLVLDAIEEIRDGIRVRKACRTGGNVNPYRAFGFVEVVALDDSDVAREREQGLERRFQSRRSKPPDGARIEVADRLNA